MMKNIVYLLLLFSVGIFAQDGSKIPSVAIPRVDMPIPAKENTTTTTAPQYSISKPFEPKMFKVPNKVYETPSLQPKISMSPSEKSDLDVGKQYADKMNKKEKEKLLPALGNITFGRIETDQEFVYLVYKDYDQPDGDRVSIMVDKSVIDANVVLGVAPARIKVRLVEGDNNFMFTALNEGAGSPNTAEFQVEDLKGNVLFSNQWGLLTGYHASIDIFRK